MTASLQLLRGLGKSVDFLRRDLRIELTYKFSLINQLADIFFTCCGYYFLARFVGARAFPELGVNYFGYILIGVAFFDYMTVSLTSFSSALRDAQMTGAFEQLLVTQTSLGTIVFGGALYHFLWTTLRSLAFLVLGAWGFGLSLAQANLFGAAFVALLSILAFSGVGILSAAMIVVFKRGNPLNWLILSASWLVGGVLYPVSILPSWLQPLARWNPLTVSLAALRAALLKGASVAALAPQISLLLVCSAAILPASLLCFRWAVEQAKISGTLGEF